MNKGGNGSGCLAGILVFCALGGNAFLFTGALNDDLKDNPFAWIMVIIAIVADAILLFYLVKVIGKPIINSALLAKNGVKNRLIIIKESCKIKRTSQDISVLVKRLEKLKRPGIDKSATMRTYHLCQLISAVSNEEHISECFGAVNKRIDIILEIGSIERSIVQYADRYKAIGNAKECLRYLEIADAEQNETKFDEINKVCNEQFTSQKKEGKAIKIWTTILVFLLLTLIVILSMQYINDTPYRELRSMIVDESLTAEMCDWHNKEDKNSYYNYFHSERGYKFIASELTEFHTNNDIEKALWLLCIQPDCIDGINLCASDSFIDWVVDYAKANGFKEVNSDGGITYTVKGFEISICSIFDYSIGHYFEIDNGTERTSVNNRNTYHEGSVPTIR